LNIGSYHTNNKLILAPMASITDHSFRQVCREEGCGLVFSEMISARAMLEYPPEKLDKLAFLIRQDKPIAVQLFGSDRQVMGRAAEVAESYLQADIIDINMGCPARKILKNKEGGWLLRDINHAALIMEELVQRVNIPVSIKIRKGWEDCQTALEISRLAEEKGIKAVTIHGRTVEQGFSGQADWEIIKKIKEKINITVIGNGDVFTPYDAKRMLDYCGCDGVMIARGALGNPWIFPRTLSLLEYGIATPPPSFEEKMEKALHHLELLLTFKGEARATKEMRKHAHWYVKYAKGANAIRKEINKATTRQDFIEIFNKILAGQ